MGRQLFIDSFLLDPAGTNATIVFHAPKLEPAPSGTQLGGGGLWWDSTAGHYKNFFTCQFVKLEGDGALGPMCLSTSSDGEHWENDTDKSGSCVVWNHPAFSRTVLLHDEAAREHRWRLLQVESQTKRISPMIYQLYTSPDGRAWTRQSTQGGLNGTGLPGDCSSAIFNPFRNVTVLSSKSTSDGLGRHRRYAEAKTFSEAAFDKAPLIADGGVPVRSPVECPAS